MLHASHNQRTFDGEVDALRIGRACFCQPERVQAANAVATTPVAER
jgi:hypothetical protein